MQEIQSNANDEICFVYILVLDVS